MNSSWYTLASKTSPESLFLCRNCWNSTSVRQSRLKHIDIASLTTTTLATKQRKRIMRTLHLLKHSAKSELRKPPNIWTYPNFLYSVLLRVVSSRLSRKVGKWPVKICFCCVVFHVAFSSLIWFELGFVGKYNLFFRVFLRWVSVSWFLWQTSTSLLVSDTCGILFCSDASVQTGPTRANVPRLWSESTLQATLRTTFGNSRNSSMWRVLCRTEKIRMSRSVGQLVPLRWK